MISRDTAGAFQWIIGVLNKRRIPFQISGGLAARVYGTSRELADIDLGVPDKRIKEILSDVKEFITYGPERYIDEQWDLTLLTLNFRGQEIDIAGENTIKFFDSANKIWCTGRCDFSEFELHDVFGMKVPVIPKQKLIEHKIKLSREVDLADVEELRE